MTDFQRLKVRRNGKIIEVDPAIIRWRKKLFKFRRSRDKILKLLLAYFDNDVSKVEAWFRKPHADLGGATPRQFLNPKQIKKLYSWVRYLFYPRSMGGTFSNPFKKNSNTP